MAVEFITAQFEASHGRSPRGYGGWAFQLEGQEELFWFTGTYGDAKKAAAAKQRELAAAAGAAKGYRCTVIVCS